MDNNSKNITRTLSEIKIYQRKKDGYINATQLCLTHEEQTGNKKKVNQWINNTSTQSILEKISMNYKIPLDSLIEIEQIGLSEEIWLHPKLALRFGMWISQEFSLTVENWIEKWLINKPNPSVTHRIDSVKPEPTISEISEVLDPLLKLGFEPHFVTEVKLAAIAQSIPRLAVTTKLALYLIKTEIKTKIKTESQPPFKATGISFTQLREIIAIKYNLPQIPTAKKVNKALVDAGLQSKHNINQWKLTKKGEIYAQETIKTSKKNKPIVEIYWFLEVLKPIEKYFKNK